MLLAGAFLPVTAALAQHTPDYRAARDKGGELSLLYSAQRSSQLNGSAFFSGGGGVQFSLGMVGPLGAMIDVNAETNGNVGGTGVAITTVTTNFDPQLRIPLARHPSLRLEGLAGEVHGVAGVFPWGTTLSGTALALSNQVGGAIDLRRGNLSIQPMHAGWVRTQLPNGTTDVENELRLSAGIVLHLGRKSESAQGTIARDRVALTARCVSWR